MKKWDLFILFFVCREAWHRFTSVALGQVWVPISQFILIVLPKLARSFVGPSGPVLSRARRTTTIFKILFSFVINAVLHCTLLWKFKLLATSQSFCMISSNIMTPFIFGHKMNLALFHLISGSILRGAGSYVQSRSSVPFGVDASPVPQGQCLHYFHW